MSNNSNERRAHAYLQHPESSHLAEDGTGPGESLRARRTTRATGAYFDAGLEFAEDKHIRIVAPDDEWPAKQVAALASLPTTVSRRDSIPLGLLVQGKRQLDEAAARPVSVVGALVLFEYGDEQAYEIVRRLTGREVF